jgi:hypothetical protein
VHLEELLLAMRSAGREAGVGGDLGMDDEGLVDDAQLAAVALAQLVEGGADLLAVGTGELEAHHDRDRRLRRTLLRAVADRDREDGAAVRGRVRFRGRPPDAGVEIVQAGVEVGEPLLGRAGTADAPFGRLRQRLGQPIQPRLEGLQPGIDVGVVARRRVMLRAQLRVERVDPRRAATSAT